MKKCKHKKESKNYLEWHEWAEKKSKTHRQVQCEFCGLWKVWVKRSKR